MSLFPVPEEEMDAYRCVSLNRYNLTRFAEEFQKSVALFEFLERGGGPPSTGVFGGPFIFYRIIAARDGALNIYHFGQSLDAVKKQLPTCPSLARTTNAIKLRDAYRQFKSYFPHADTVRHAIAHAGELRNTPSKIKSNQLKGFHPGEGFLIGGPGGHLIGALYERTYSVSNLGEVFSVSLNLETIQKLKHVISLVDAAFRVPAEPASPPA